MKGGFEGWLFVTAVWVVASTEIYFCDKWGVGFEREQTLAMAGYAKIAGAVVLSYN